MSLYPRLRKLIGRYLFSRVRSKKYKGRIDVGEKKIFFLDTPTNGNIGDQAIAVATKKYLSRFFPDYRIVEIPNVDVNFVIRVIKQKISKRDIIVWNGGGNIGDLYPSAEWMRWDAFKTFKDNKFIMFPQSVFFKKDTVVSKRFETKSINNYRKKKELYLFLRENESYKYVKNNFKISNAFLVPDIVFTLDGELLNYSQNHVRHGAVALLRDDIEKGTYNISNLVNELGRNDIEVFNSDMISNVSEVNSTNREKVIKNKLGDIAQRKLVITDRLHGMIFGYLTRTPTIVITNNNWKIKSTYNTWLQNVNFITLISNNIDEHESHKVVTNLLNVTPIAVDLKESFSALEQILVNIRNE